MRKKFLVSLLILFVSCSISSRITSERDFTGNVNLNTDSLLVASNTPWFSGETISEIEQENLVAGTGDYLFSEMLIGYANQMFGVEQSSSENADISFMIRKVEVKRGYFTINFPNPGPIYKMAMEVDIYNGSRFIESATFKTRVNMSVINFGHLPFKWMSPTEMENTEYQLETFEAGLRKLYQKLYFEYFEISLIL